MQKTHSSQKTALFIPATGIQKPEVAWKFTEAREKTEGRNIPKSAFIEQFFGARDTINRIQTEFAKDITIFLVKKDFEI